MARKTSHACNPYADCVQYHGTSVRVPIESDVEQELIELAEPVSWFSLMMARIAVGSPTVGVAVTAQCELQNVSIALDSKSTWESPP